MDILAWIAERRIEEAMARGAFRGLVGEGKPIALEDSSDPAMPEELRVAYRVLKHGGFVPPEVALRGEIHSLAELIACVDDATARKLAPRFRDAIGRLQRQRNQIAPDPLMDSSVVLQAQRRLQALESIERAAKTNDGQRQRKDEKAENRP